MKKQLGLVMLLASSGMVQAAAGDWLVRARVVDIAPDVSVSDTLAVLKVDVDKKVVPELDFTYMLTSNWGAELILGTAKHKVTASGASLGKVSHLPPTLTAQYHFSPQADLRPYVGAGLNYTRFYSVDLPALALKKNSFGPAMQLGVDYALDKAWFINLDVKKIWIQTDVSVAGGAKLGTLKVNPWVFGLGVGSKF